MAEKDRTVPIASHPLVEKALASRPAVAVLIGFNVEEISGGRGVGCLQAGPQRANPIRWTRYTEEAKAMWRTRQPDPRDREPRQSSFSISSRNRTSARRGSTRFADRRRHNAHPARADHGGSDGAGLVSAGSSRRPAVGSALLCADRRPVARHHGDPVHRPGHPLDLCAGSQRHQMA
jgi:hypothetical protein